MIKQFLFAVLVVCLFSCHSNPSATEPATVSPEDTIAANFFPVTSFIKGQMLAFDSLDVTPLHIISIRDKNDSQWIKKEQLKLLLAPFLKPEINNTNLAKYFKETKFNDQSINAITFTYDPIGTLPDSIPLQNWTVYVSPQTSTVTRIFMTKSLKENNQFITQQLTWESNTSALIVDILNKPDGSSEVLTQDKFIWSF
jgi:hypothetical protein